MNLISWASGAAQRVGHTLNNDLLKPVQRDVIAPVAHAAGNVVNAVEQAPQVVNRDVVQPITRAPQNFVNDVAAPVDRFATRSAFGRGAQAVGLGALRSGVGTLQGLSGLYDLATPGMGTNRFSKELNKFAPRIDLTAKTEHSNPLLYHGAQTGTDLLTLATPGIVAKVAGEAPRVAKVAQIVSKLSAPVEDAVKARTAALAEKGIAGRVAANSVRNIAKPGYQAANAAFTALQAGKQASTGHKVTPASVAENLAIGGIGLPIAGAAGKEVAAPLIKSAQHAAQLTKSLGLKAPTNLSPEEITSARKVAKQAAGWGDQGLTSQDAKNLYTAQKKLGVTPGSPQAADAIQNAVLAHNAFDVRLAQRVQALQNAKQKAQQFAQDHPIGLTSGAVDENGNRLGLNGKPLNSPKALAEAKTSKLSQKAQSIQGALAKPNLTAKQRQTLGATLDKENARTVSSSKSSENNSPNLNQRSGRLGSSKLPTQPQQLSKQTGQLTESKVALTQNPPDKTVVHGSNGEIFAETDQRKLPAKKSTKLQTALEQPGIERSPQHKSLTQEDTPLDNNNLKERGFTTSVKESKNYTKGLRKNIASKYAVIGDKTTITNTQKYLAGKTTDVANQDVLRRLGSSKAPGKQLVNDAGTVMQILDSEGRTGEAQHIHDLLAAHLTKAGQTSQAAGLLLRRSPDGIYHKAVADLNKAGVEVTPSLDEQLKSMREDIRKTAPDTSEREIAVNRLKNFVNTKLPSSANDKAFALWRAGLLTGPRTIAKILTSHGIQLPLETIKNIPAATIDKALSVVTGQRSLILTGKGIGQGLKEGAHAGFSKEGYLRSGVDIMPGTNDIELHKPTNFGLKANGERSALDKATGGTSSKLLSGYANGVGRLHGSLYKPFYGEAFRNSLASQAEAAAETQGLKGLARRDFVNNYLKQPPTEALDQATHEAQMTTFQQETGLGKAAHAIQSIPAVGKYIAPFTRIPAAITTDILHYSPVGWIKPTLTAARMAADKAGGYKSLGANLIKGRGVELTPQLQREMVQAIGRSTVGAPAALLPGYILYNAGLVTTGYPTSPTEQKIWQREGKQENSVLIGGKWRSLGSLGPFGGLLALGAGAAQGGGLKSPASAVTQAIKNTAGEISSEPYISGITSLGAFVQNPTEYAKGFVDSNVSSIVPTALSQIASASDKNTRQVNTPIQSVENKIPGLRQTLTSKKDSFGQTVPNTESGPLAPLDPFYSSTNHKPDATVLELQRLENVGQGTMPGVQATKNSFNGVPTQLTKSQSQALSAQIGTAVKPLWDKTIASPSYQSLSDDQKHQTLANILSDTTSAVKQQYAAQNNLGQYSPSYTGRGKALTAKQDAILSNNFSPDVYTAQSNTDVSNLSPTLSKQYAATLTKYGAMNTTDRNKAFATDNAAQYQYDLAKYYNNKANGSLSTAQDIQAQATLAKEQVGSNFSQNVRQLYGLSKTELYNYLNTPEKGVAKGEIANQLIAYDNALVNAGIITKGKFATGFGPSSGGSGGSSSKKTAQGIAAIAGAHIPAPKLANPTKLPAIKTVAAKKPALKTFTPQKFIVSKGGKISVKRGIV